MIESFGIFGGNLSSITPALLLTIGFVTGLQHATETDHVAAIATIVSKSKKLNKASLLGALWGLLGNLNTNWFPHVVWKHCQFLQPGYFPSH